MTPPQEKRCSSCKVVKPLTAFYARYKGVPPTTPQTTNWHCKVCSNARSKEASRKHRTIVMNLPKLNALIAKYENRLAELYAAQDRLLRTRSTPNPEKP